MVLKAPSWYCVSLSNLWEEKKRKTWLTPLSTIRRVVKVEYIKLELNLSGALTASSLKTEAWGLHDAFSCHGDSGLRSRSWRLSDSSNCALVLSFCLSSRPPNFVLHCKSKDCILFSELYMHNYASTLINPVIWIIIWIIYTNKGFTGFWLRTVLVVTCFGRGVWKHLHIINKTKEKVKISISIIYWFLQYMQNIQKWHII